MTFVPHQILFSVVKVVIKALSEELRMLTFSTFGLQQVEVDVYYLGTRIWPLLGNEANETIIGTMFSHMLAGATTRCVEPAALSAYIITMICDKVTSSA